jgi:hypothetical protein
MSRALPVTSISLALGIAAVAMAAPTTWTFDGATNAPPAGWAFTRTGDGRTGRWALMEDKTVAPPATVLAQLDTDETDYRFPVAVARDARFKDLRLSVRCKPVEGKVDQAGGLVFRYKDENNYYVVRLNALENNVRLYHVVDGRRIQFGGWNGKVAKNTWHDLAVESRGDKFQVFFNGKKVIDASDRTFSQAGAIGLWTKADSLTYFDDLNATRLD